MHTVVIDPAYCRAIPGTLRCAVPYVVAGGNAPEARPGATLDRYFIPEEPAPTMMTSSRVVRQ